MAKKKVKTTIKATIGVVVAVLLAMCSWKLYNILNNGFSELMNSIGITNLGIQFLILLGLALLFAVILGKVGAGKALKKILRL